MVFSRVIWKLANGFLFSSLPITCQGRGSLRRLSRPVHIINTVRGLTSLGVGCLFEIRVYYQVSYDQLQTEIRS